MSEDSFLNEGTKNNKIVHDNSLVECSDDSIQNLVSDMQAHFKTMSQTILNRIDDMGTRIDQLEFMLNDLISEIETTDTQKEQVQAQNITSKKESEGEVQK